MQGGTLQLVLRSGASTTGSFSSTTPAQPRPTAGNERPPRPVPLLAEYAVSWLESIAGLVRPRTLEAYTYRLEQHILPRLGERRLDEVSVDDVVKLIRDLRQRGYSGWTVRTMLTPLSRMCSHAVRRGIIPANPVGKLDRTERPPVWRREQRVLSTSEIARVLEVAPARYRTLLAVAIFTGLRQGELLALRWEDIDLSEQVIHVRSALDRSGRHVEPKTRSARRDVVLLPALVDLLEVHRMESRFPAPNDYVFASRVGTPLHWRNVARRALQPALHRAGIEHLRWHDLRHTYASLLVAGGANITWASRQLGHGSPDITLRVYGHLFDGPEHAARTRAMLESSFGEIVTPSEARAVPADAATALTEATHESP